MLVSALLRSLETAHPCVLRWLRCGIMVWHSSQASRQGHKDAASPHGVLTSVCGCIPARQYGFVLCACTTATRNIVFHMVQRMAAQIAAWKSMLDALRSSHCWGL